MSLQSVHPLWQALTEDWMLLRDFYAGDRAVKSKGVTYLPATAGMVLDGMTATTQPGYVNYLAFKARARVPDYIFEGVKVLVGLLHQKNATIELPSALEYLRTKASNEGETLDALHRRINVEQLITGRLGLLVDMPENPDPLNPDPYIALYVAESIRNWDNYTQGTDPTKLNMLILDESQHRRVDQFEWKLVEQYRVLELVEMDGKQVYKTGTFETGTTISYSAENMKAPMLRGKVLENIPFTFINSKDVLSTPDIPPLLSLANLCLGIYLAEADYRQSLYMQGQDTLVVIGTIKNPTGIPGEEDAIRTGAGSRISVDLGGDAKYIGVGAEGLAEQRLALELDRNAAILKAGQLVQSHTSQAESGEALSTRFTAQTATLNDIALSSAAGLELALKQIAVWKGANPDEVKVTPNLEFVNFGLDGQNFVDIMTARSMGFPISIESLHAIAVDRGLTVLDFNTEVSKITTEQKTIEKLFPQGAAPGAAPTKPAAKEPVSK